MISVHSGFKDILKRIGLPEFKKEKKIESDDIYCYTNIIWNDPSNLIILISYSKEYFEQIIEIQDAINYSWHNLCSKIVYSSYDEVTDKLDENGNPIIIIHKKYYMLIGGKPIEWQKLYMNIHDLGNEVLSKITDEIVNNCDANNFKTLIEDGILYGFTERPIHKSYYDSPVESDNGLLYTDPEILLKRLPSGFTGRDLLKFIKLDDINHNTTCNSNAYTELIDVKRMSDDLFKALDIYKLYSVLFKDPTVEKLSLLLEPLYKQPDDDSVPGDVSDEALDILFRENYERFSAVIDDSIKYEDIDEELSDDEESENIREGDKIE